MTTDNHAKKNRIIKALTILIGVFLAGIVYAWIYRTTGFAVPCIFRRVTGLKCPGCGVSTMLMHLCYFEFAEAFWENPLLFVLLPVFLTALGYHLVQYIRTGRIRYTKKETILAVAVLILLLIFGVWRNVFEIFLK